MGWSLISKSGVLISVAVDAAVRVEIDATNNAELRANAHNIISAIHTNRPKNTMRGYNPKQIEFQVS